MGPSISRRSVSYRGRKQSEGGFSLIEVMISMVILTVGLVSLLGVFGLAMSTTMTTKEDMIAKQLANETLESIMSARNSSQLSWDDIQNTGSTNCASGNSSCGLFTSTTTAIYNAGTDGLFGTSDDSSAGVAQLQEPGPDGIFGTSDDVNVPLNGYQRTILISAVTSGGNVIPSLRSVNITIQYSTTQSRQPKSYVLNTFISQYR
jgi:type IV pilus modification protein PilV